MKPPTTAGSSRRHVLVVRLSALGDVAILAPVLRRVAAANPTVRFTVAAPPMLKPLFSGMAGVDFLGVEKKRGTAEIARRLSSVQADAVADMHAVNRVLVALAILRLRALGHGQYLPVTHLRKGRLSRWLFLHHLCHTPRRAQWQRYEDVLRRLGLHVPEAEEAKMREAAAQRRPIGVAPFSQHEGKVWPWENTMRLVRMLSDRGEQVLLFGSRAEAEQLEQLAAGLEGVTSVAGRGSFAEELELIGSLGVMVSMDSANMHFASAVGTRVVSLWGATHPDFGFYGYGQQRADALCANLPCQPCSAFGQRRCHYGDHRCLRALSPEQVVARIYSHE